MEETVISKIKTQIEEIEKRIKAIAMQMTTTSQMSAIKYCLEEIKQLLIDLGTELDTHLADYSNHKDAYNQLLQNYNSLYENFNLHTQDYKSLITDNNNAHANFQNFIDDLIISLKEVEAQADNLQTRIMVLEEMQGGGGQTPTQLQTETTNFVEQMEVIPSLKPASYYMSPITYFKCEPTQEVFFKIEFEGNVSGSIIQKFITLKMNSEEHVMELRNLTTSGSYYYEVSTSFVPSKSLNYFYAYVQLSSSFTVKRWKFTITARNIAILGLEKAVKIVCFNDQYYITYNVGGDYILYGVQNRGELSLGTGMLNKIQTTDFLKDYCGLHVVPALKNEEGPLAFDDNFINNVLFVALRATDLHAPQTLKFNEEGQVAQSIYWTTKSTSFDFIPCGIGKGSEVMISTSLAGDISFLGRGNFSKVIKYNGEYLVGQWFGVATVKNNNAKIGDENITYNGMIAWREDGMNVYFPEFDNTYCVEIAKGKNVSAYLQEDGSINVYMNRLCNVYKYVLRKNLDGIFEVSNIVTCIKGITRYEELYDGQALIYKNAQHYIVNDSDLIKE